MENRMTTKQRRLPKFRRAPELYGPFRFSETDLEILRLVHDYRYVTADHVFALTKGNQRHLADRLQGLFHHSYLQRLLPPPAMRVADAPQKGSEKFTYVLDEPGASTLARAEGIGVRELAWEPRHANRMNWFVEHQLMIGTLRAVLELALRQRNDLKLIEWRGEDEIRDAVSILYSDGSRREHRVAPDGYLSIRHNGINRNFFLECDRGTERDARILPKFQNYWLYTSPKSPFFKRYQNAQNRLILFICTSEARLRAMRQTLLKADPEHRRGLAQFWFTLASRYSLRDPKAVLGPIWYQGPRTAHDDRAGKPDPLRTLFEET